MWIRAAAALVVLAAAVGGASAEDASGCEKFKWSIARERAWFAADPKPVEAGAELGSPASGYVVALVAGDAAASITGVALPVDGGWTAH